MYWLFAQTSPVPPPAVNSTEDLLGWILWAVVVVIFAMAGAITFLYRFQNERFSSSVQDLKDEHKDCNQKFHQASEKIVALTQQVGELHGQLTERKSTEEICTQLATRIVSIVDERRPENKVT